jgi:hypothetical protein
MTCQVVTDFSVMGGLVRYDASVVSVVTVVAVVSVVMVGFGV